MSTRSSPLCSNPHCPRPSDPDFHRCFVCGKEGGHHHHVEKRSTHPDKVWDKNNIVFLCPRHHDQIDNGLWSNHIKTFPDGSVHYFVLDEHGKTKAERILESKEAHYEPQETPWPVTVEPHGLLKGKALPAVVTPVPSLWDNIALLRDMVPAEEQLPPDSARNLDEHLYGAAQDAPYERPALLTEGPITWEQYCELVANLEAIELNLPFWIGDTIIKGEELFGEKCYQPWTAKGYKAERLRQYAWVAQQIPAVTRVPSLSFTHHRAVAALPPGEQAEWLERAEQEGMSSRQLRECVTVQREPEGCQHEWQCQKCGVTR